MVIYRTAARLLTLFMEGTEGCITSVRDTRCSDTTTHLQLSPSLDGALTEQHLVQHHVTLRLLSHVLVGEQRASATGRQKEKRREKKKGIG